MIFVTVGTHEQQFNRLVEAVDRMKANGVISGDVLIQTGYSTYKPVACRARPMMGFDEMDEAIKDSEIVITHGGPGSIFSVLRHRKIPIVVPRRADFNEHVDMHQVEFAKFMQTRGNIIPVFEIEDLEDRILHYFQYVSGLPDQGNIDATGQFLGKFRDVIKELNLI